MITDIEVYSKLQIFIILVSTVESVSSSVFRYALASAGSCHEKESS